MSLKRILTGLGLSLVCISAGSPRLRAVEPGTPPSFERIQLTEKYYADGIHYGDVDRDGRLDIVSGPFWYRGPEFKQAKAFYAPVALPPEKSPSDSMYSFVHDFSGDGWPDILVLGRVHLHPAYWYENPGQSVTTDEKMWTRHYAFERVQGESPPFVDLDGDGRPQLVCHWQGRWGWIEPDWQKPREPWSFHPLSDTGEWKEFYHGTGVGDLNGDGRSDLVLNDGWFEQPQSAGAQPNPSWPWHPLRLSDDRGGAQIPIYDVDGDGDNDLVTAMNAHGWGLAWFEQLRTADQLALRSHPIMGTREQLPRFGVAFTQPHALDAADVNGDGLRDIIVGKRLWAHGPTGDIEPAAAPVLYWFELRREASGQVRFIPHLVDDRSGVGVQVVGVDINRDGDTDILTASKLGSFLFRNLARP
jgi:hypothetical protein